VAGDESIIVGPCEPDPDIVMYGCAAWEPVRDIAAMAVQDRATGLWRPGPKRAKTHCATCLDGTRVTPGEPDYCEACGRAGAKVSSVGRTRNRMRVPPDAVPDHPPVAEAEAKQVAIGRDAAPAVVAGDGLAGGLGSVKGRKLTRRERRRAKAAG
jgi:hypothetical protein